MRPQAAPDRASIGKALAVVLFVACGIAPGARPAAGAGDVVVIVNAANSTSALAAAEVSSLFLKKTEAWPDKTPASPVDLDERSPARESFSRQIHSKRTAAIKSYWQKMIFSGREVPPPEKASPEEVVRFVRSHPGGIGYVPAGTPLGSGVKILEVRP
ncbi:MAG TPA: phosphate ABC transporter substrate-binding protein [Thermoanaerobaculia bacterium]|jgi:ABC-type phosphate transport system substrate-binding protein|nr:phosphate ABC transporter substrate-binding protein [Thermoanaerobaculia bacterium]